MEPSEHGARRAQECGLEVYHGQLEDYLLGPGKNERFDVITANHVVEHAPHPFRMLRAMKSLLARSGVVWIGVPNPRGFFGRKLLDQWHSVDLPYHLHQFSAQSMAMSGERAGLTVSQTAHVFLAGLCGGFSEAILEKALLHASNDH